MIRLIAVAFALAVATSAQAMSPAPLHQPDGMITESAHRCRYALRQWSLHNSTSARRHVRRGVVIH